MAVSTRYFLLLALAVSVSAAGCSNGRLSRSSSDSKSSDQNASGIMAASRGTLAPVYAPLAEQLASDFNLREKEGVGIDLGSGPGTLILELCRRTRMHWINADINPDVFPSFFRRASELGLGGRVSAVLADAQALPFHDNYADIVVSRGSFHFWEDKTSGFREIYRVLKPGAAAYIGRGFSKNLPVDTARAIRAKQGKKMKYDPAETAEELRRIMAALEIETFTIHRPRPPASEGVNYGVWIEFYKPAS